MKKLPLIVHHSSFIVPRSSSPATTRFSSSGRGGIASKWTTGSTGAPKIRAMEIIDELEPTARGVYTGAIGYFGFDGSLDLNIAIRTVVIKDGAARFHVGGGIVADSDAAAEYEETLDKARAIVRALQSGGR